VQAISPPYGEIDVPVIILAGSSDQMVDVEGNVRRLAEALANGRLVLLEGTGHKLHHTHSDVVMDAIDEVMEASGRQGSIDQVVGRGHAEFLKALLCLVADVSLNLASLSMSCHSPARLISGLQSPMPGV
jgi:hypothetical protein